MVRSLEHCASPELLYGFPDNRARLCTHFYSSNQQMPQGKISLRAAIQLRNKLIPLHLQIAQEPISKNNKYAVIRETLKWLIHLVVILIR